MSTDGKTKAELVPIFNKLMDEDSKESGNTALLLVFEVLCDIRDGLIKEDTIEHDQSTK